MLKSFKSPLTIYVLWHPEHTRGAELAQSLFNGFSRKVGDPFARTPGIPVFFRSAAASSGKITPMDIPYEESEHTAIVVLVDDQMVVCQEWKDYVARLDVDASKSDGKIRIFPVAINTRSFNFPIAAKNFIRLFEVNQSKANEPAADPKPATAEQQTPENNTDQSAPAVIAARPDTITAASPSSVPTQGVSTGGSSTSGGITINVFINGQQSGVAQPAAPADAPAITQAVAQAVAEPQATTAETQPAAKGMGNAEENDSVAKPVESTSCLLELQARFLIGKLVHELSRFLYHAPRVTESGTTQSAPPVRMFISHAKADGADIATAIRDQIHSDTSLKSFFDANDIAIGYRFSDELLSVLETSAVICVQTDYYATREWCLWEVINAKRFDRPLVVVNAVTDREPRSFPYLGNVPTVRWKFDAVETRNQIQDLLDMALFEVLGTRFREMFQRELVQTFELPDDTPVVGHPPELFTILKMADDGGQRDNGAPRYVVYPEPPLGDEEIRVLEDLAPGVRFVTPTMLPLIQHQIKSNESSQ